MTIKLTSRSEIHHRESALQVSILAKLVVARFLNSAVLTFLVTRKADMLTSKFTRKIQFVMLIDLFSSPLVRLLDVYNLFCRYVYAPRTAKTQAQLNRHFNGTFWNLAERYTDMMKKVFFTFFYAWLTPSGFLITGVALCFDYFVDKYLLLRRWRTPTRLHSHLSVAARAYFYASTIVAAFMFIWAFRHWPFDCAFVTYSAHDDAAAAAAGCQAQFSSMVIYSTISMPWPNDSAESQVATVGVPILLVLLVVGTVVSARRTLGQCMWLGLRMCCCTKSRVLPEREMRMRRQKRQTKIDNLKKRHHRRASLDGWKSTSSLSTNQAGRGGVKYSQLEHPDWYIPRLRSVMEVDDADEMDEFMYRMQSKMRHVFRKDWTWAGQTSTFPDEFSSPKIFHSKKWIHRERTPGSHWLRTAGGHESSSFRLVLHHTPAEYLSQSGRRMPSPINTLTTADGASAAVSRRPTGLLNLDLYAMAAGHAQQSGGGDGADGVRQTTRNEVGAAKRVGASLTGRVPSERSAVTEGTTTKPWWWYGVGPSQMNELEREALNHHLHRHRSEQFSERMRFIINQSPSILEGAHQRIRTPVPEPSIDVLLRNSPSRKSMVQMSTVREGSHGDGRDAKKDDETRSVEYEYGSIEHLLASAPSRQ